MLLKIIFKCFFNSHENVDISLHKEGPASLLTMYITVSKESQIILLEPNSH